MSIETFECDRCGASFGITGPGNGSDDDLAAYDYFSTEVDYHQSGECAPREVEPTSTPDPRAEYIAGLAALADVLAANPELPLPQADGFEWSVWPHMVSDVPAEVARIRRLLPGTFTKNEPRDAYNAKYYTLTSRLHGLTLEISTYRDQVCERVVTGTREVTEDVPVKFETVTKTVEDVEWVCKPLLAEASS